MAKPTVYEKKTKVLLIFAFLRENKNENLRNTEALN